MPVSLDSLKNDFCTNSNKSRSCSSSSIKHRMSYLVPSKRQRLMAETDDMIIKGHCYGESGMPYS